MFRWFEVNGEEVDAVAVADWVCGEEDEAVVRQERWDWARAVGHDAAPGDDAWEEAGAGWQVRGSESGQGVGRRRAVGMPVWSWVWPLTGERLVVEGRPLVPGDLTRHGDQQMEVVAFSPGPFGLPEGLDREAAWKAWVVLWKWIGEDMVAWVRRLARNSQVTDLTRAMAVLELQVCIYFYIWS